MSCIGTGSARSSSSTCQRSGGRPDWCGASNGGAAQRVAAAGATTIPRSRRLGSRSPPVLPVRHDSPPFMLDALPNRCPIRGPFTVYLLPGLSRAWLFSHWNRVLIDCNIDIRFVWLSMHCLFTAFHCVLLPWTFTLAQARIVVIANLRCLCTAYVVLTAVSITVVAYSLLCLSL